MVTSIRVDSFTQIRKEIFSFKLHAGIYEVNWTHKSDRLFKKFLNMKYYWFDQPTEWVSLSPH